MPINKRKSLHTYLNVWMLLLMLLLLLLIGYNNQAALKLLRGRIYGNTTDTMVLYQKEIDQKLDQIETFLYTIYFSDTNYSSLKLLAPGDDGWGRSIYYLKNTLEAAESTYQADSFFCYYTDTDTYVYTTADSAFQFHEAREILKDLLLEEHISSGEWFPHVRSDHGYLYYVIRTGNSCVGCRINMEKLLKSLTDDDSFREFDFILPDGTAFLHPDVTLLLPENEDNYRIQPVEQVRTFAIFQPMESGDFYLTRLIPYVQIAGSNRPLVLTALSVIIAFLLIWFMLYFFANRQILQPVRNLTEAIEQIRIGKINQYVPSAHQPQEFHRLSHSFNEMVAENNDLKIDIYEKKLKHQNLEIQFLKQQITPHFLINCLNMVDALMDMQHFDLAKKMLKTLSIHIRYTLSSGQTTSLQKELELCQNYIELSGIRYPGAIRYNCSCPPELGEVTAIPLLILNFLENNIKYEVVMGQILQIDVAVETVLHRGENCLHIRICDSGEGYPADVLERLQKPIVPLSESSYHIGIANVVQRAEIVYPIHDFMFSNRPCGGAQVDIYLSLLSYADMERSLQ